MFGENLAIKANRAETEVLSVILHKARQPGDSDWALPHLKRNPQYPLELSALQPRGPAWNLQAGYSTTADPEPGGLVLSFELLFRRSTPPVKALHPLASVLLPHRVPHTLFKVLLPRSPSKFPKPLSIHAPWNRLFQLQLSAL